mgnify:CR=1 FL=1
MATRRRHARRCREGGPEDAALRRGRSSGFLMKPDSQRCSACYGDVGRPCRARIARGTHRRPPARHSGWYQPTGSSSAGACISGTTRLGVLTGFASAPICRCFPRWRTGSWQGFRVIRRSRSIAVSTAFDEAGEPVEDLAAAPCTWSDDKLTITCRLRDAQFHDGVPLTADDVAFTFELLASDACFERDGALAAVPNLADARAADPRTAVFRLKEPDAAFPDPSPPPRRAHPVTKSADQGLVRSKFPCRIDRRGAR